MVVIGIIAILGAIAVPGFKKVYVDFKIMEAYDTINTMLSAIRSYYLIYSDQPNPGRDNVVEDRMLPLLSGEWVKKPDYPVTTSWGKKVHSTQPAKEKLNLFLNTTRYGYSIYGYAGMLLVFYYDKSKHHYYWDVLGGMLRKRGFSMHKYEYSDKYHMYIQAFRDPRGMGGADPNWFR